MAFARVPARLVLLVPLCVGGCEAPLKCTTPAVVERISVKLDRELRENPDFLVPHLPGRSRFAVDAIRQEGMAEGALACTARLAATLETPTGSLDLQRQVHFTAHRDGWDTFVEIVSLDAAGDRAVAQKKEITP